MRTPGQIRALLRSVTPKRWKLVILKPLPDAGCYAAQWAVPRQFSRKPAYLSIAFGHRPRCGCPLLWCKDAKVHVEEEIAAMREQFPPGVG